MGLPEKVIRLGVGMPLIVLAVLAFNCGAGPYAVFMAAVLGVVAGICLHPFLSAPLSQFVGSLFYPNAGRRLREQYTVVHGLIAQGQFSEAETQLRETLRQVPEAIDGWVLLAELLHTHLHRSDAALQAVLQALTARRKWESDKERLVMLAVDICLDQGDTARAKAILTEYAKKAGRSGATARMSERLMHLP